MTSSSAVTASTCSVSSLLLATILLWISFVSVLVQCTSSQPLSASLLKAKTLGEKGEVRNDSIGTRSVSHSDASTMTQEDNDYEELFQLLAKLWLIYSEQQRQNRPAPSTTPVRRANFWKRANFWRKRANFWRRDLVR